MYTDDDIRRMERFIEVSHEYDKYFTPHPTASPDKLAEIEDKANRAYEEAKMSAESLGYDIPDAPPYLHSRWDKLRQIFARIIVELRPVEDDTQD